MSLPEITAKFTNPAMAQQMLVSIGWRETTHRIFTTDNPPQNAAGWVELRIHKFATVDGAAEALPFLAWGRGNLVVRATAIAPDGDPTNDVIETILIPLVPLATDPRVVTPELLEMLPGPEHLSPGLTQTEVRARSASNTADTFINPEETSRLFQEWGWLESASGVYTGATSHGSTRFEIVVYRWRNAAGASAALSYFVGSRASSLNLSEVAGPRVGDETRVIVGPVSGGTEATVYMRSGAFLFRFTAIGPGDPMADVLYLLGLP